MSRLNCVRQKWSTILFPSVLYPPPPPPSIYIRLRVHLAGCCVQLCVGSLGRFVEAKSGAHSIMVFSRWLRSFCFEKPLFPSTFPPGVISFSVFMSKGHTVTIFLMFFCFFFPPVLCFLFVARPPPPLPLLWQGYDVAVIAALRKKRKLERQIVLIKDSEAHFLFASGVSQFLGEREV